LTIRRRRGDKKPPMCLPRKDACIGYLLKMNKFSKATWSRPPYPFSRKTPLCKGKTIEHPGVQALVIQTNKEIVLEGRVGQSKQLLE